MAAKRIYLLHWNDAGRTERSDQLKQLGFEVLDALQQGSELLRTIEREQPQAILIDLSRLPSQGRDMGVAIRKRVGTRSIPLIYVGGQSDKVARIREILPDAHFCEWDAIKTSIEAAILQGVGDEVTVPESVFAAYKGKPLVAKLGIGTGDRVYATDAPDNLPDILGELPEGARLVDSRDRGFNLVLRFTVSEADLQDNLEEIVSAVKQSPVWIIWPKKASGLGSDLSQPVVRKICMAAGMVDYKVCSVDATWTGLLFTWRG
jgi:CheY-like chemotaxis protein